MNLGCKMRLKTAKIPGCCWKLPLQPWLNDSNCMLALPRYCTEWCSSDAVPSSSLGNGVVLFWCHARRTQMSWKQSMAVYGSFFLIVSPWIVVSAGTDSVLSVIVQHEREAAWQERFSIFLFSTACWGRVNFFPLSLLDTASNFLNGLNS